MSLSSLFLSLALITAVPLWGARVLVNAGMGSVLLPDTVILDGLTSVEAGTLCQCKTLCFVSVSCTAATFSQTNGTCRHTSAAQADIVTEPMTGITTWLKFGVYVPKCLTVDDIPCTAKNDGVFYLHPTDCSKYLACAGMTTMERPCAPTLFFDKSINSCNYGPLEGCMCQTRL